MRGHTWQETPGLTDGGPWRATVNHCWVITYCVYVHVCKINTQQPENLFYSDYKLRYQHLSLPRSITYFIFILTSNSWPLNSPEDITRNVLYFMPAFKVQSVALGRFLKGSCSGYAPKESPSWYFLSRKNEREESQSWVSPSLISYL